MRPKRLSVLVSAVALLLCLAACTNTSPAGEDPGAKTLTVGATLEPPTLDPSGSDAASIPQVLLYNVYETLIKLDADGEMQPLLAEKWEPSEDRLTYTFTLSPDATFPDGRSVTAADVKWSLERFQQGDNVAAKAQLKVVKEVEASDERTVVVHLSEPSNRWLFNMASTAGIVFDSKAAADDFATVPVGSGPYALDRWTKGSDLVLKRNDSYWRDQAAFGSVTFRYFTDPNAQNSAMLSGGLDVISSVQAPQAIEQFSDTSRYTVIEGTTQGEVVMSMNNSSPALKDKRVRQAINYAIDRQGLIDTVWNGKGTLIGSMVPPTDPWYEDLSQRYPYDPAKAKALLKEAGHAKGLKLRMRVPVVPYATGSAQFIASQLKEVGITATIEELEFPRWLDEVFTKADYDISIVNHVEPRDIVKYGDPKYYWRYDNPEVTKLITEADRGTEQEQVQKMKEVAKIISDDAAADWLFLFPNLVVTTVDVTGVPQNATTLSFDLTDIRKSG